MEKKKITRKQSVGFLLIILALSVVVFTFIYSGSPSSPTNAAVSSNTTTITKAQYGQIKSGMTYEEVKKIVGSDGDAYYESGDEGTETYVVNYMWHGEDGFSTVSITCSGKDQKVISKSQGGLK